MGGGALEVSMGHFLASGKDVQRQEHPKFTFNEG